MSNVAERALLDKRDERAWHVKTRVCSVRQQQIIPVLLCVRMTESADVALGKEKTENKHCQATLATAFYFCSTLHPLLNFVSIFGRVLSGRAKNNGCRRATAASTAQHFLHSMRLRVKFKARQYNGSAMPLFVSIVFVPYFPFILPFDFPIFRTSDPSFDHPTLSYDKQVNKTQLAAKRKEQK